MTRLGVGIIGCGGAALDMARAIDALPDVFVAAAHDRVQGNAADLVNRYGGTAYPALDDLLTDPSVDIVYVGLPHDLLAPTAHRGLDAGKHVLVEKPGALDVQSLRTLKQLALDRGLRLGVVLELREAGTVREARRIVHSAAIGSVRAIRIRTIIDKPPGYWHAGPGGHVSQHWRGRRASAGGGVVLMNSIHQIDTVRYVTGLTFVRAIGEVATLTAPVEVEDYAAAALRLSNGAIASLAAAAHSPGAHRDERIEIDGSEGRLDLPDPYGPGCVRLFLRRPWDNLPAGVWLDIETPTVDTHRALVSTFVETIRAGTPPTADADDAAAALATVLAIYTSAAGGAAIDASSPTTS